MAYFLAPQWYDCRVGTAEVPAGDHDCRIQLHGIARNDKGLKESKSKLRCNVDEEVPLKRPVVTEDKRPGGLRGTLPYW